MSVIPFAWLGVHLAHKHIPVTSASLYVLEVQCPGILVCVLGLGCAGGMPEGTTKGHGAAV